MATTIGKGLIYDTTWGTAGFTSVDFTNPANGSDNLQQITIGFYTTAANVYVGTFYGWLTNRSYAYLGNVTGTQTFTGLNIQCSSGDWIGMYCNPTQMYGSSSSGNAVYWVYGNQMGKTNSNYNANGMKSMCLGGTSAAAGKKWNGITISKWNGTTISKINAV